MSKVRNWFSRVGPVLDSFGWLSEVMPALGQASQIGSGESGLGWKAEHLPNFPKSREIAK